MGSRLGDHLAASNKPSALVCKKLADIRSGKPLGACRFKRIDLEDTVRSVVDASRTTSEQLRKPSPNGNRDAEREVSRHSSRRDRKRSRSRDTKRSSSRHAKRNRSRERRRRSGSSQRRMSSHEHRSKERRRPKARDKSRSR